MTSSPEIQQKMVKLIAAIENGDLLQVKCLLDAGVDVNKCPPGLSLVPPLGYAVAYGHLEIVETLLLAGAYPHGYILLQLEPNSEENTLKILSLLINAGINVNFQLEEADTLLMKAARRGELNLVKLLLKAGADVNQTNQYGESALLGAAYGGWQKVYEYLAPLTSPELRAEAEKQLPDGLKRKQRKSELLVEKLISAAVKGESDAVLGAIEKGVDINIIGAEGHTALFTASTWGHLLVVRTLINAGANLEIGRESNNHTPLMAAAGNLALAKSSFGSPQMESNLLEIINLLIKAGANVNAKSTEGWNALIAAANSGSRKAVELLLEAGAEVNVSDNGGDTAINRAKKAGNAEIVQLLLDAGATED